MPTTHQLHIRLPADLHDRIRAEAKAKPITVTAWITHACTAYLDALDKKRATP